MSNDDWTTEFRNTREFRSMGEILGYVAFWAMVFFVPVVALWALIFAH